MERSYKTVPNPEEYEEEDMELMAERCGIPVIENPYDDLMFHIDKCKKYGEYHRTVQQCHCRLEDQLIHKTIQGMLCKHYMDIVKNRLLPEKHHISIEELLIDDDKIKTYRQIKDFIMEFMSTTKLEIECTWPFTYKYE